MFLSVSSKELLAAVHRLFVHILHHKNSMHALYEKHYFLEHDVVKIGIVPRTI